MSLAAFLALPCRLATNLVIYLTRVMGEESGTAAIQVLLVAWAGVNPAPPFLGLVNAGLRACRAGQDGARHS
jgi:hypothetical protein